MTAASSPSVPAFLEEARALVDGYLEEALPRRDGPARLAEAMRYSVFAGGKRLRPALALAAARAVGGDNECVLPYAAGLELVHTYSLIHDDLPAMDDDDMRRGRPTSHRAFGEALAILAGDALHTLAFEIVLGSVIDAATGRALALELAYAAGFGGMVGGQVDDLDAAGAPADAARVARIHRAKTASLFRAACRGGAIAAGADGPVADALARYGLHLGLAFQIVDDVLDETGTADSLGKTPGKDRAVKKMTYVALEGVAAARDRAERETQAAIAALRPLRDAKLLVDLAQFVTNRDR